MEITPKKILIIDDQKFFVKGGVMLFFNKQKSSALYANIVIGFRGGIDYRMGVYLAVSKD